MSEPLLQGFYDILNEKKGAENSFIYTIRLNPSHPVYQGHFPEMPVAPGVCLVQMLCELATRNSGKELYLAAADNIKFLGVINPHECGDLAVEISLKPGRETHLTASIKNPSTVFVKFKGSLREAPENEA